MQISAMQMTNYKNRCTVPIKPQSCRPAWTKASSNSKVTQKQCLLWHQQDEHYVHHKQNKKPLFFNSEGGLVWDCIDQISSELNPVNVE